MSIIKNDDYINKVVTLTKEYYEFTFNENFNDIEMDVSDNINEDTKLFIDTINLVLPENTSGRYIKPNDLLSVPLILVKYDLFNQNGCSYIGTILHELTHASDYGKFNNEYCNGDWSILEENINYSVLYLWSEYHAKVVEIIHMRKLISILFPDQYIYNEEEIKNEMTNYHLPRYNNELVETLNNGQITFSEIFKYCGRLYTCELYNLNYHY